MSADELMQAAPEFDLERFFAGRTSAWGLFEDRFGRIRRRFTVDIAGGQDGECLTLDEHFVYDDGARDRRIWRIRKTGADTYEGRADDVIGVAKGQVVDNALHWEYDVKLNVFGLSLKVRFKDFLYMPAPGLLMNRALVSKLGIELGSVTLVFLKPDAGELTTPPADVGSSPAASR